MPGFRKSAFPGVLHQWPLTQIVSHLLQTRDGGWDMAEGQGLHREQPDAAPLIAGPIGQQQCQAGGPLLQQRHVHVLHTGWDPQPRFLDLQTGRE